MVNTRRCLAAFFVSASKDALAGGGFWIQRPSRFTAYPPVVKLKPRAAGR